MGDIRNIRRILKGRPTLEGAGVHLKRVFGNSHVPLFDPFLLLDDFRSDHPDHYLKGFPWHPHRGIETITYMIRGHVEHGDSMGNRGVVGAGDVQWMTAGSGVIHQEMPKGDAKGSMGGFQLWANLPRSHKMMAPRYRDVRESTVPEAVLEGGVRVKVICGSAGGLQGPVRDIVIDPEYLDITVPAGREFLHPTRRGHTVLAYVIKGKGFFCPDRQPFSHEIEEDSYFDMKGSASVGNGMLVLFSDGDEVSVATEEDPIRFLLVSGRPIGEPVAWYGPIVMNTQEELRVAFAEYQNGTFIKEREK